MAFIKGQIYSFPEQFRIDLEVVLDFVERHNKQDIERDVAAAQGRIEDILQITKDEEEKSDIVDALTSEQEDKLKDACMKDYHGDKEHWEDAYEGFIEDLTLDELKKILA